MFGAGTCRLASVVLWHWAPPSARRSTPAHGETNASRRRKTTHSAQCPQLLIAPYTAAHDAAVCGTLQASLGEPAEDADCHAHNIAYSLLILAGLVLHRPSAHPLLLIGLHGPMVSVCSRRGARPSQNGLSGHLEGDTEEIPSPACLQATDHVARSGRPRAR